MATRNVVLTYPDAQAARLLNSFALGAGYDSRKRPDETKAQFLDRMIIEFVNRMIQRGESEAAAEAARQQALADAQAQVLVT